MNIHEHILDAEGNPTLRVRTDYRTGNVGVNVNELEQLERSAHKFPGKRLLVDGENTLSGAKFLESPDWVREAGDLKSGPKGSFYLLDKRAISEVQILK